MSGGSLSPRSITSDVSALSLSGYEADSDSPFTPSPTSVLDPFIFSGSSSPVIGSSSSSGYAGSTAALTPVSTSSHGSSSSSRGSIPSSGYAAGSESSSYSPPQTTPTRHPQVQKGLHAPDFCSESFYRDIFDRMSVPAMHPPPIEVQDLVDLPKDGYIYLVKAATISDFLTAGFEWVRSEEELTNVDGLKSTLFRDFKNSVDVKVFENTLPSIGIILLHCIKREPTVEMGDECIHEVPLLGKCGNDTLAPAEEQVGI